MLTSRMKALRTKIEGLQLVSFSVDPADNPERLSNYAKNHRADWVFLTGKPGEVRRLCQEGFKLPVADGTGEDNIIHSKKLVLVDGKGFIRGYYDSDDSDAMKLLIASARTIE